MTSGAVAAGGRGTHIEGRRFQSTTSKAQEIFKKHLIQASVYPLAVETRGEQREKRRRE